MKLKCLHVVVLLVFVISLLDLLVFNLLDLQKIQQTQFHMVTKQFDNEIFSLVEESLNKKGYSLSDLPPKPALWTDKVHLCINFNLNGIKPNKQVTETLMSYYLPFFKNITLIFNGDNWSRPDYVPEFVDFISCDSHIGWYQHKCLRSCIQRGSEETKGFLYIAEDMFINLTKMAELPITKLWIVGSAICRYSATQTLGHKGCEWGWWGPPTNGAKNLDIVIKSLPAKWMELTKTAGFPDHFHAFCTSDIIYIPQALVTDMTHVLDHIISTAELFCEIATILAVNIVAPNRTTLVNGYLWGDRSMAAIKQRATTAHFVHPVKLGIRDHRDIWIQYMEKQLFNIIDRRIS